MPGPLSRWLLAMALLAVPQRWRADVRRDLLEERGHSARRRGPFWLATHAVAVGLRLRAARPAEPQASWLELSWRDAIHAGRGLLRDRGWTLMAVSTLALGIGANTAVFSVINTTILNPLPYRDADRLVLPTLSDERETMNLSPTVALARAWRDHAKALEALELYSLRSLTLTGSGDPEVVAAAAIAHTLPAFTGVPILRGRGFSADEAAPGGAPVAILSEGMWRRRFAADPTVIGRTIVLDGVSHTVVGVFSGTMRFVEELQGEVRREVYVPLQDDRAVHLMARLGPGVTDEQATAELQSIGAGAGLMREGGMTFFARLRRPTDSSSMRDGLVMLTWAVALVLLIACTNVTHLVLARGLTRGRELAIRTALGAGRGQIARGLTIEGLMTAAAGGIAGVVAGAWMLEALTALRPPSLEPLAIVAMDWRVMAVAAVLSITIGLAFGLVSAWRSARTDAAGVLRATGTATTESLSKGRLRAVLVVAEVAAAVVLLVGSLLLVRSVNNLQRVNLGFDARGLYTVRVPLPPARCSTRAATASPEWCRAQAERWLEQARAIPGVEAATLAATAPPHAGGFTLTPWETRAGISATDGMRSITATNRVRPDYFDVTSMRIVQGRGFDAGSAGRREVMVSASLAARLWSGSPAVGQELRPAANPGASPDPWLTVVGVVADASIRNVRRSGDLVIYFASETGGTTLLLRAGHGAMLASRVRAIALEADPTLALPEVIEVAAAFDESSVADERFNMRLLAVFAGVAALLAAVGLYGVVSHAIARRTREIGIRLALGGTPGHVVRMVLARAVLLTMSGVILGLILARWAAALLSTSLFGVELFDPVAYAGTGALMLLVTVIACVAPLGRALRVDPLLAVRAD